jgi:hypothetical protein
MIEIFISAVLTILLVRKIKFLGDSSLNRIWAVPLIFISLCLASSHVLEIEQITPMRYFFSSYILYQLLNLAKTSRRIESFLFLNQRKNSNSETDQRIRSLLKSHTIAHQQDSFKIGNSFIFHIYNIIARLVLSTRKFNTPTQNLSSVVTQYRVGYGILMTIVLILITNLNFLFSRYPTRDSLHYHFNSFEYLSKILRKTDSLPALFPAEGGVPIELSSMSFGLTSIHKFLGFIFYDFLGEPYFTWKISFIAGISLYCVGIFLIAHMYTNKIYFSIALAVLASFVGIGNSFHQEQVLYTAVLWPFIYLLIHKNLFSPDKLSIIILMAVLGLISFVHFPQIQIAFILFTLFVLWDKEKISAFYREVRRSWALMIIALLSTSLFTLKFIFMRDTIVYPLRIAEGVGIVPNSIKNFLELNQSQASSGASQCKKLSQCFQDIFLIPSSNIDDLVSLYIGPLLLVLLLVVLFFKIRIALVLTIATLLYLGPADTWWGYPQLILQFIFLEFRQWYHFFPILFFFLFLGIIQLFANTSSSKFKSGVLFKRSVLTLLIVSCFLNFGWKIATYRIVSQADRPPNFTQNDKYFEYLRNPNIINLKSQYKICKEEYSRVEPYQYPEVQPIGLLTTTPNLLNSNRCLDTKVLKDTVSVYALDKIYQKESLSLKVDYLIYKSEEELPLELGEIDIISILNGGRVNLSGWINSKMQPISINLRVGEESFQCSINLTDRISQVESQSNLGFKCIFQPSPGTIYNNSDFQVIVITNSTSYILSRCCDALFPNKLTVVPILNNNDWLNFKFDFRLLTGTDMHMLPLWNVSEWDSRALYLENRSGDLTNQVTIPIKKLQIIELSQPNADFLSFYFLFLYFLQLILVIVAFKHAVLKHPRAGYMKND